jgi:hypothetical protein
LLAGLGLLLLVSAIGIRWLDQRADPPWLLGLPASTVLMGVGLVLFPLLLVGFGFAAGCDPPSRVPGSSSAVTSREP